MIAVVQRAVDACVTVDGKTVGKIGGGLVVLLGIVKGDSIDDAKLLAAKCSSLHIFEDADGKMNLSIKEASGKILAISQFTLAADCRRGRRPSFDNAAEPVEAEGLYNKFCDYCADEGIAIERGIFAAHMQVSLVNDGPVTIILDTDKLKDPR